MPPILGGLLPFYDPFYPRESSPLLDGMPGIAPLLDGIPGKFFIPPIAILFETAGSLKSSAPLEPIPGARLFIPLPEEPMLP